MTKKRRECLELATNRLSVWVLPATALIIHGIMLGLQMEAWRSIATPLLIIMSGVSVFPIFSERTTNFRTVFCYMLGILIFGAAEIFWSVMDRIYHLNPAASPPLSYLYAVTNLSFLLAVVILIIVNRKMFDRMQLANDMAASILMAVGFLVMAYFDSQIFGSIQISHISITNFIYLLLNIISITVITILGLSIRHERPKPGDVITLMALMAFFVADSVYVTEITNQTYVPYQFIDWLYVASLVMLSTGMKVSYLEYKKGEYQRYKLEKKSSLNEGSGSNIWILAVFPVLHVLVSGFQLSYALYYAVIIIFYLMRSLHIQKNISIEKMLAENSQMNLVLQEKVKERTSQLHLINKELKYLLKYDGLTGFYSRSRFASMLNELLPECGKAYLIKADIDRFRIINDLYGNHIGDEVLKETALRIREFGGGKAYCGRMDGNEFAVLFCEDRGFSQIHEKMEQLVAIFKQPLDINPFKIVINMHYGIAEFPTHADNGNDMMNCAKAALEQAKSMKLTYALYDEMLYEKENRHHEIEIAIRKADLNKEFTLHYQPEFDSEGRRLFGMEALIRCKSPYMGPISPIEVIKVAEETGFILEIGEWVMRTAMHQITAWNMEYGTDLCIGINISPLELQNINFIDRVKQLVFETGVDPAWLNFEITESSTMDSMDRFGDVLTQLSELGISVSIDDFGTGYASYGNIKRFSIDYLKIDKLLIDTINTVPNDALVVKAIIAMADALEIRTIAEGVETQEQARLLNAMGCDIIQGYLYGRPVSAEEFSKMYLNDNNLPNSYKCKILV